MRFSSIRAAGLVFGMSLTPAFAENVDVMDRWYESVRQNDLAGIRSLIKSVGVNARDARGSTPLHYAAAVGSPEAVDILIASGANVNTQNAFGISPLMLAVTEPRKVRTLVSHDADVNAKSKLGRTPLLLASMVDGASGTVRVLLDKGAAIAIRDEAMQTTPLIAATAANDSQTIELLLARGANVNDRNVAGITPLMNASGSGNVKIMRELILRGADVNAVSGPQMAPPVKNGAIQLGLFTPLLLASSTGGADAVKLLLQCGAKIDAQDVRGMTPLMLAVATDHADAGTVRLLLAHGADPKVADKSGQSTLAWARKFAQPAVLRALALPEQMTRKTPGFTVADARVDSPADLRETVNRSVALLQQTGQSFLKEGGCVSCHTQNLTAVAVRAAKDHGATVDEKIHEEQRRATETEFASADQMLMQRMDPPAVDILTYAFLNMVSEKSLPGRATDAMIHDLAAQQSATGNWRTNGLNRPPMADADFSRTAMAIRSLRAFGSPGRKADLDSRIGRAAAWLERAHPVTTEDRVMRMMGLVWAGKPRASEYLHDILALQQSDGGWAQTSHLTSDAYATGQVLCALHDAGIPSDSPAYQRGLQFLLRTRAADGSWYVKSRAPKFQPYFESGFPYGHDQWISSSATSLATAAVAYALPGEAEQLSASR